MSVCLFVCQLAYLKNHFIEFFCAYDRGSVFFERLCDTLRTSGFVDDVMFSHNWGAVQCFMYIHKQQEQTDGRSDTRQRPALSAISSISISS